MVAVAVDTRGRYEASEPLDKLNRREHELGTAVGRGPGQPIDEPRLRRAEGDDTAGGVEPFQSEGGTSTVAEQPFDTCPVLTLDADGRIDTESRKVRPHSDFSCCGVFLLGVPISAESHWSLTWR